MALVGGLIGGAGGNIGSASVALLLNTSQFDAGLAKAHASLSGTAAKMQAVGSKMTAVGGALTRGLSVPLAVAGGVATKMALDFNQAFVRIQTLGGKTGQSMESLKSQVLDLAEATGQDPGGLANALYLVTSAGKDAAANAIPILTQAAKGAALGMGDVNEIAKVLTATTNSYGAENLSAAQAMDILTQATTDSSAEADELAASLGPVIGIASQVGISFQEVAAAMATATTQGVSTDRAATGLRFLMQSLAAPTQEASQKLEQYGFTAQDLQRLVAKEGLQGSLQELADTFDLTSTRGQQAWSAVVGGARGAIVANTLVGKHAADAAAEVENLGNVADVTNEKFEIWGQTITGKNAKALGELKAAAIRIGTELIPIFEKIVNVVGGMVRAFNNLPQGVQAGIVAFGLWAAALGPIIGMAGKAVLGLKSLGQAFGLLSKATPAANALAGSAGQLALPLEGAAAGASTLASTLVALGIPVAAAIGWFALFKRGIAEHNEAVAENIDAITKQKTSLEELNRVSEERARGNMVTADAKAATDALEQYRNSIEAAVNSQISATSSLHDWAIETAFSNQLTAEGTKKFATQVGILERLGGTLDATEQFQINNAFAQKNFGVAMGVVNDDIREQRKELDKTNVSLKESTGHGRAAAKSATAMGRAYDGASKQQKEFLRDGRTLDKALRESNQQFGHGEKAIRGMGAAATKTGADLRKAGDDSRKAADDVGDFERAVRGVPKTWNTKVTADVDQAKAQIDSFITTQSGRTITLQARVQPVAGTVVRAQHGFEGTVSKPTMFLAGEAGMSEHVSVRPSGHGRASADRHRPTFVLNFNAPVMGSDVGAIVEKALTDRILKRGALV